MIQHLYSDAMSSYYVLLSYTIQHNSSTPIHDIRQCTRVSVYNVQSLSGTAILIQIPKHFYDDFIFKKLDT